MRFTASNLSILFIKQPCFLQLFEKWQTLAFSNCFCMQPGPYFLESSSFIYNQNLNVLGPQKTFCACTV